ncbi:MAG: ureidoglycolate lyase [Bdellovibrionales bacterium]|nr:ureidoglycolate lyase [Bdellovibrionales bacterium]
MKVKLAPAPLPLNSDAYRPFGDVIAARGHEEGKPANQGTARRHDQVAELVNLRPGKAQVNVCVFRADAFKGSTFEVKLLEHHPKTTQMMIPMNCPKHYLVIVAMGNAEGNAPDLSTMKAFLAKSNQGITYHPGVWHHPLIALDQDTDFACVVYEDGSSEDCSIHTITPSIQIPL